MRKIIDAKIKQLLENSITLNQRCMFIIVGDRGRDQIVTVHGLYDKIKPGKRFNILWCYRDELGFSQNQIKNVKRAKNLKKKGMNKEFGESSNNFPEFIVKNDIKFVYYKETQRVLGNTFDMVILQDFEAITPNVLCRTIETVAGAGIVIFLFSSMTSLKQLYTISMDVHDRYRTSNYDYVEPRFNERFILTLGDCKNCIVMDDELNILPISNNIQDIQPLKNKFNFQEENVYLTEGERELKKLKISMKEKVPIGHLINTCKTIDQAKCLMEMVESISEKVSNNTVSITAGRGRGKSSAMGLAISSAIVYGYSNIFVTAPSPENLKTFFEFVVKGLKSLNYREKLDFDLFYGENDLKNVVVRVVIFKDHKQSINYIEPINVSIVSHAEIVVIDEAAAIPLHIVKKLMAPCLVFMASTIHGYEGTGRSLSLKLIKQLRENSKTEGMSSTCRKLKEIKLEQAIRYADNDPIESWLNNLLCLDAIDAEDYLVDFPDPKDCELYLINRDTLFSYHSASEAFLKKIMGLFVSSHYKNSPNDLQLLSDAASHSIFVLMKKMKKNDNLLDAKGLPDVLVAIQVALEGGIPRDVIFEKSKRGDAPPGDLIPWTVGDHFQDKEFPNMTGLRIVRIATHSQAQRMGYGTKAMQKLIEFYEGNVTLNKSQKQLEVLKHKSGKENDEDTKPKKKLRPLLGNLEEETPPLIYWIGTSFGLTLELYNFWSKAQMFPVYLKLAENDITGEHSCIMLKPLRNEEVNLKKSSTNDIDSPMKWIHPYNLDFKKRLVSLLGFDFKSLSTKLAMSVLNPNLTSTESITENSSTELVNKEHINFFISNYDLKRMELYSNNLIKHSMILDIVPTIAKLFFQNKTSLSLSYVQAVILLGVGLQYKSFDDVKDELNKMSKGKELSMEPILGLFNKLIKKFYTFFKKINDEVTANNENGKTSTKGFDKTSLDNEFNLKNKRARDYK